MTEEESLDPNLDTIMIKYKILAERLRYLTSGYYKNRRGTFWMNLDYCNTQ